MNISFAYLMIMSGKVGIVMLAILLATSTIEWFYDYKFEGRKGGGEDESELDRKKIRARSIL